MTQPRKRVSNPDARQQEADLWLDVEYMDVYHHVSKNGNDCIKISYTTTQEEWPVNIYYSPKSQSAFARGLWHNFVEEIERETDYKVKGLPEIPAIVEQSEDWPMPYRLGCVEEFKETYRNIRVLEYDWGNDKEDAEDISLPAEEPDSTSTPASHESDEDLRSSVVALIRNKNQLFPEETKAICKKHNIMQNNRADWQPDAMRKTRQELQDLEDDLPF